MHPPWTQADAKPTLGAADVHVWLAALDLDPVGLANLRAALSPDETARAERFARSADRDHWIAARGILRHILSRYAHISPRDLRFKADANGKPALSLDSGLSFNLSHSGGIALYAVCRDQPVGVDVEAHHRRVDIDRLAARVLAPSELSAYRELPDDARRVYFYRRWVAKEAYAKATGLGLAIDMAALTLDLPAEPSSAAHGMVFQHNGESWALTELLLPGDFSAALVTRFAPQTLKRRRWTPPQA